MAKNKDSPEEKGARVFGNLAPERLLFAHVVISLVLLLCDITLILIHFF